MAKNEVRITFLGDDKGLSSTTRNVQTDMAALETQVKARSGGVRGAIGDVKGTFGDMAESAKSSTGLATGAIAAFAIKAATDFSDTGRKIEDFSTKSGMAVEDASRWVAVADDAGLSLDDLSGSFGKLAQNIGTNPEKLQNLGVELAHTKDGAIDLQGTFLNVVDAFNNTDDAAQKAELGSAAFGKQWQGLVRLLDQGSGEIKSSLSEVKDFQIFDEDSIDRANEFHDSVDKLKDAVDGLIRRVGELAAGPLGTVAGQIGSLAEDADAGSESVLSLGGAFSFLQNFNMLNIGHEGFDKVSTAAGAAKDAIVALTDNGPPAVVAISNVTQASDEETAAMKAMNDGTLAAKDAQEKAKQTQQDYEASVRRSNEALEAEKAALDAAKQALEDKQGAALAALDSELALNRAVDGVSEALKTNKADSDAVKQSLLDAAGAASQFAEDEAEAQGKTFSASDKIAAQRGELEALKQKFPELSGVIDGYIAKLDAIPRTITTTVIVNDAALGGEIVRGPGGSVARAGGGDVHAAASGMDAAGGAYWVGEQGPELFVPGSDGHIFPANSKFGGAGKGGGNTYININMPPGSDGDDVVRALKRYERRNGVVPVRTL